MKKIFSIVLPVFLFILWGCQKQPVVEEPVRPKVIVSMAPYKTFVQAISDGKIEVICLVPDGTNPHLYETPPQLIEEATKAKVWFCLGEPGEKKFAELFMKRVPGMHIVDLSEGLPLISQEHEHCSHDHTAIDKHIWLSPRLAKIQADKICEALCLLSPEDAPLFRHRLHSFQQKLHLIDEEISSLFAKKEKRILLVSHPSLGYFCRDYKLEQLAIEVEGKEPLPLEIEHIFTAVRKHHIDRILVQPQHPLKGAYRIAEELHLSIETIDPYGEDYFTTLRSIAHAIEHH